MPNEEHEKCPPYHPGLGELPRAIATERKELEAYKLQGEYAPPGTGLNQPSADLNRQTSIIDDITKMPPSRRAPPLNFYVQSTYDSRPIQGYDFQASKITSISFETSGNFSAVSMTYTVPENTIAIVRGYRYQVSPIPVGIVTEGSTWLQSDFFDNGTPIREHVGMYHAVFMREFIPTFFIVDERHVITFQLSQDPDSEISDSMDGEIAGVLFEIFGNLIPKTGIPKEYEIASKF
jgi:hypothetical protein